MEKSKNIYLKPFPKGTLVTNVVYENPGHTGPFRGAVDFAVALGTPALAPLEGVVHEFDDSKERYGLSEEFADDVNYVTIRHANDEFSQVLHLAKGSAKVKVGDRVRAGQIIAMSGNSGWMTEPHLHFFVFENLPGGDFRGLEIQFKE